MLRRSCALHTPLALFSTASKYWMWPRQSHPSSSGLAQKPCSTIMTRLGWRSAGSTVARSAYRAHGGFMHEGQPPGVARLGLASYQPCMQHRL